MTLPGQFVYASASELAENPCEGVHEGGCGKPSTKKQAGEVDSFGAEWHFLCDECLAEERRLAEEEGPSLSTCEKCGNQAEIKPYRDPDEGMSGPVYWACRPCINKYMEYYREEEPPVYFEPLDRDDGPWTSDERVWDEPVDEEEPMD